MSLPIKIAVLDTSVSQDIINNVGGHIPSNITVKRVPFSNPIIRLIRSITYAIANRNCFLTKWIYQIFRAKLPDHSHGDTVVLTLLEELDKELDDNQSQIEILCYDVARRIDGRLVIPLFNVLCALDHFRTEVGLSLIHI